MFKDLTMKKLLRIDTSTRKNDSHSRDLANRYEKKWKEKNSDSTITYRDLSETKLPHLTQPFIDAMFTVKDERDTSMNETLEDSQILIEYYAIEGTSMLSSDVLEDKKDVLSRLF